MAKTEFEKYAVGGRGVNPLTLDRYAKTLESSVNPTIIEERRLNAVAMDVFSRLMMDRIIFLGAPIDDEVANVVMAQLLFLAANAESSTDINLYLNTPGGSVSAGLAIYDTIRMVQPDVATICAGQAASMGAVLLCAGAAGKRACLRHSRVLIHQPLGGMQGQASDMLIAAREIERIRTELYSIISRHSGQPLEKVAADADRDFWMNSQEALEYGMIDRILQAERK